MDDFDFSVLEGDDELKRGELLALREQGMVERGRMIAEEMALIGHRIDPLTFLLTDFHDLCQLMRLSDEQAAWLSAEFAERGTFARVLSELGALADQF